MGELTKALVEFDKNKTEGKVFIKLSTELLECQDRLALTARFKEEVEDALTEEEHTWSSIFKVTQIYAWDSGHKCLEFEINQSRLPNPSGWSEELYKDNLFSQIQRLCRFVEEHVHYIEDDFLRIKLPQINKTIDFLSI